jgi:FkbM family methyltransferase
VTPRRIIRKALNAVGYDIHRQIKDSSGLYDPEFSQIKTVNFLDLSAKFFVADCRDVIQSSHYQGVFYEEDICLEIANRFKGDGLFVDIGANVGNHAIFMAARFPQASVIAFEPMRLQHSILVVNYLLNDLGERVKIHKIAASDEVSSSQMITPNPANIGRSMITDAGYGEWVESRPADQLLEGRSVDFIKIDVEGHELRALKGLEKTIGRCRPKMLVEVAESNSSQFRSWLAARSYRVEQEYKHYGENSELMVVPT